MEYLTKTFENTPGGLRQKDEQSTILASQGFRIISEHIEQGHIKGGEACCGFLICAPLAFLAGRTAGNIIVTYGREVSPATTQLPLPQPSTYRSVPSSPVAKSIGFSMGQAVAWLRERPVLFAGLVLLFLVLVGLIAYH
jgi:hypothetical protein